MGRDTAVNTAALAGGIVSGVAVAVLRPDLGPLSIFLVAWSCGMVAALVMNQVARRWGG